jgi:hypothetical protein
MSANKQTPNKIPEFKLTTHPDFRIVHVNAFFGGLNPTEGHITFYTDILQPKMSGDMGQMAVDKIQRESQVEIRLSTMGFIELANWMNNHIKKLEEMGIIKKEDIARTKQSNMPIV